MFIIIGIPPHIIIMGMPASIMPAIRLQHSMNISMFMPCAGFISHIMPVAVILHDISHAIIGIIFIIGIAPFIIGFMPIIMWGIPIIIGFIPIMEPIIIGFMFIGIIDIIGIAFILSRSKNEKA